MTVYLGDKAVGVNTIVERDARVFGASIKDVLGTVDSDNTYTFPNTPYAVEITINKAVPYALCAKFANSGVIGSFLNVGLLSGIRGCAFAFYNAPSQESAILIATDVTGNYACQGMYYNNFALTQAKFRVGDITGEEACSGMYLGCEALRDVEMTAKNIIGQNVCVQMYAGCTSLEEAPVQTIEAVSGTQACYRMFSGCTLLRIARFESLTGLAGTRAFALMFEDCEQLEEIYFPMLTTIATNSVFGSSATTLMCSGCTNLRAIHFRADMQETVEALSGYSTKWGATNAEILFDL